MSKRVWLLPALAILLVAVGGSAAFAVPSLGGPSGIVSVPNALVAPVGQAAAAVSWQSMTTAVDMYEAGDEDFSVWSLQVLGGVASGAELWAAYSTADDLLDTNVWGVGGKFQSPASLSRPPLPQSAPASSPARRCAIERALGCTPMTISTRTSGRRSRHSGLHPHRSDHGMGGGHPIVGTGALWQLRGSDGQRRSRPDTFRATTRHRAVRKCRVGNHGHHVNGVPLGGRWLDQKALPSCASASRNGFRRDRHYG
jgi:hypothetical protein